MKTSRTAEYRVSERVVLQPGDQFRASGGPYWVLENGEKVSLKAYGPYKFRAFVQRGAVGWIEATDKDGNSCVLHVVGRRRKVDTGLVPRPYVVTGKKRPKSQRLDNRRKVS